MTTYTTQALAALKRRAQIGFAFAAIEGVATTFGIFKGQLLLCRDLANGYGDRLAEKDAATLRDEPQACLQAAWAALPVNAETLTMAEVQQILATQGFKVAADGVAGAYVDAVQQLEHGKPAVELNDEHAAPAVDGVHGALHAAPFVEAATVAQQGGAA